MSKSRAERRLERQTDELEHRIERLRSHIDRARGRAEELRPDAERPGSAIGSWQDTAPDRPGGDDPDGAVG